MPKLITRIRNVFDNHLEARSKEGAHPEVARMGAGLENQRVLKQATLLNEKMLEEVKAKWVSDLMTGVTPGVAEAYAAGRLEQFNRTVGFGPARVDVRTLQAEVAAIADRLRSEHLRAAIQANREGVKEGQRESHGIKV